MSGTVSSGNFNIRYQQLLKELLENPNQRKLLEAHSNCIALAGPGSGKTKTLTGKIARLLNEEITSPRGVACMTYSNECADEILNRLAKLGIEPSQRLYVGTVHGFCLNYIIRPYAHLVGVNFPNSVTTSEQEIYYKNVALQSQKLHSSRRNRDYLDKVRREPLRRTGDWSGKHGALWGRAVLAYEHNLRANDLADFGEMVRVAVTMLFHHEWLASVLRARFPVVVVDEYQDLGYGLHTLVTKLMQHGVRLIAVGDPDQSIYGFAGATPHLLDKLHMEAHAKGEAIRLDINYRCAKAIINASVGTLGKRREFYSNSTEVGAVIGHQLNSDLTAQVQLAVHVLLTKELESETPLGEIGFLYPERKMGTPIADELGKRRISFRGAGEELRYRSSPFVKCIEQAALWCAKDWQKGDLRLSSILKRWERVLKVSKGTSLGDDMRQELVGYLWRHRDPNLMFIDWLEGLRCLKVFDMLNAIDDREREIPALESLFIAAGEGGRLQGWSLMEFSRTLVRGDLPHLVTIHSSKGLEYDTAILVGLEKLCSIDPNADDLAEARRKLYVALTRARKSVHLLWSGAMPNLIRELHDNGLMEIRSY